MSTIIIVALAIYSFIITVLFIIEHKDAVWFEYNSGKVIDTLFKENDELKNKINNE